MVAGAADHAAGGRRAAGGGHGGVRPGQRRRHGRAAAGHRRRQGRSLIVLCSFVICHLWSLSVRGVTTAPAALLCGGEVGDEKKRLL